MFIQLTEQNKSVSTTVHVNTDKIVALSPYRISAEVIGTRIRFSHAQPDSIDVAESVTEVLNLINKTPDEEGLPDDGSSGNEDGGISNPA